MSYDATGWVLYAGPPKTGSRSQLVKQSIVLEDLKADEVLAAPVYGCWEANMSHALDRVPVDVCRFRGESPVVLGNAGVVRILETGTGVTSCHAGQHAIVVPNGVEDQWAYTVRALGYDAPHRSGMLATLIKLTPRQLVCIPESSKYSLVQWAAFSARYVTAWSNWQLAFGVFRLQVPTTLCPEPNVWGWGGGTTFAELDLAKWHGCRTAMLSGSDENLALIARKGITPVDRRSFCGIEWDEELYHHDLAYRRSYQRAEALFLDQVKLLTDHRMVQIFLDYIGAPVYKATLRALSREGVIATAGWKKGMKISYSRAEECISRHQHVHTHYARHCDAANAAAFAEETGWMPDIPARIYCFDEIPQLAEDYHNARTGYFPCFSVNGDVGTSVLDEKRAPTLEPGYFTT